MRESPRLRRLRTDFESLRQLKLESSIFDFTATQSDLSLPPEHYVVRFYGKGLWRPPGVDRVFVRELHEVEIRLGAAYPRNMPELRWKTPIFHPNISSSGSVCLGGYGKHWVPGLRLDELCHMLWDMMRFDNYDVASPFNRDAASWIQSQSEFKFPLDTRPIRNLVSRTLPNLSHPAGNKASAFVEPIPAYVQPIPASVPVSVPPIALPNVQPPNTVDRSSVARSSRAIFSGNVSARSLRSSPDEIVFLDATGSNRSESALSPTSPKVSNEVLYIE